jgi:putative endonuclease
VRNSFCIYILTNKNKTVLYTGVTNSLERRIWEHKQHAIPGFTKKYNCDRLIYFEEFTEVRDAIAREKQIKGWLRVKKETLVATTNPEWNDLASGWYGSFAVFAAQDDTVG